MKLEEYTRGSRPDAWDQGEPAVLDYLARHVFRVAITNSRIVGLDEQSVAICYKQRKSNSWRTSNIPGQAFIRRFLQNVLPRACTRFATSTCGIPPSANSPPAHACCFGSTVRRDRAQPS